MELTVMCTSAHKFSWSVSRTPSYAYSLLCMPDALSAVQSALTTAVGEQATETVMHHLAGWKHFYCKSTA